MTETPKIDERATFRPNDDGMTDWVMAAFARELERENARLRELVKRACKIIDVPEDAPITAWASDDEINDLLKDCGDILANVRDHEPRAGSGT